MRNNLRAIIYALIVSAVLTSVLYITQYSNELFIIKGAIFFGITLAYVAVLFYLKDEQIIYVLIFMSMMNVPIRQFYTSSTNILILIALLVLFVRYFFRESTGMLYERIKNNSVTLPLILVICSYTVSLLFAKMGFSDHFEMYQSIIFASVLVWMIIGNIREKSQIMAINNVMLAVLLINLVFSFFFILYPEIDAIRAHYLSMPIFEDESASRLQGLSFRGEAYGEYLMICALWLFTMLIRGQLKKGRAFFWLLTLATVSMMIMTRLRGANAVFFIGAILVLLTSGSVQVWKKTAALTAIVLVFTVTLFALKTYSNEPTLLDRYHEFSDTGRNVGNIPETRYYTWVPSLEFARSNQYLGAGPSYAPYITKESSWRKIVAGDEMTWPHNITLTILSTVGIYGLISYMFLAYRTIRLRKVYTNLEQYLKNCYSAYLICFIMFLIEAQKFDGFLRHPDSSFYLIFILIAVLFSCENLVNFSEKQYNE
jgi:O-antigen ligase